MSQEKAGLANLAPKHGSSRHKKLFRLRKLSRQDGYFPSSYMHFWAVYSMFLFVVFRRADDTLQDHHTRMLASPLYVDTVQLSIFKQSRETGGRAGLHAGARVLCGVLVPTPWRGENYCPNWEAFALIFSRQAREYSRLQNPAAGMASVDSIAPWYLAIYCSAPFPPCGCRKPNSLVIGSRPRRRQQLQGKRRLLLPPICMRCVCRCCGETPLGESDIGKKNFHVFFLPRHPWDHMTCAGPPGIMDGDLPPCPHTFVPNVVTVCGASPTNHAARNWTGRGISGGRPAWMAWMAW